MYTQEQISEVTAAAIAVSNGDTDAERQLSELLGSLGTDILYYCPIYIVSVNLPGYLPDNPPYAVATAEDAAACLADELERTADACETDGTPYVSADSIARNPATHIEFGGYVHSCVECDASYIIPENF